jgi:N-acyl-D-aspartate/D-glutamate deacylase
MATKKVIEKKTGEKYASKAAMMKHEKKEPKAEQMKEYGKVKRTPAPKQMASPVKMKSSAYMKKSEAPAKMKMSAAKMKK